MRTQIVTLNRFQSQFDDEEKVVLNLNDEVKCYQVNRAEDGSITEGIHEATTKSVNMSIRQLSYQLYNADARIAMLRGLRGKSFTFPILASLLSGAEVEIDAAAHKPGDVDDETGFVHQNASFTYNITSVKLADDAETKLVETINIDWLD